MIPSSLCIYSWIIVLIPFSRASTLSIPEGHLPGLFVFPTPSHPLQYLAATSLTEIPKNSLNQLTAPYLKPILETLQGLVFNKQGKPPNIFDHVASVLRLSPYKLKSDISIIQRKYIGEVKDDDQTRTLLGRIILHTAHRQLMKSSFGGIPSEIFKLTQSLLLSAPHLAQMDEMANKLNITEEDWAKSNQSVRRDLLLARVAINPRLAQNIIEKSIHISGLNKDTDFMLNLVSNYRFFSRAGKKYARKIKNKHNKIDHSFHKRSIASTSENEIAPFEMLNKWLIAECGNIRNRIKQDIYETFFSYDKVVNLPLNEMIMMDDATTKLWLNATYLPPNSLSKSEKSKMAENLLLQISKSLKEHTQIWNFIDQLLEMAGFKDRLALAEAIKRISRDKRFGMKLQHFKFLDYGSKLTS